MNKYEHNWAMAAMVQGNLKNFHGHARHLAHVVDDTGARGSSQDDMGVDTQAGDEDNGNNATPPLPSPSPSDSKTSSDEDEE